MPVTPNAITPGSVPEYGTDVMPNAWKLTEDQTPAQRTQAKWAQADDTLQERLAKAPAQKSQTQQPAADPAAQGWMAVYQNRMKLMQETTDPALKANYQAELDVMKPTLQALGLQAEDSGQEGADANAGIRVPGQRAQTDRVEGRPTEGRPTEGRATYDRSDFVAKSGAGQRTEYKPTPEEAVEAGKGIAQTPEGKDYIPARKKDVRVIVDDESNVAAQQGVQLLP